MAVRHVALLRGVNNVGTTRVAMADLRVAFEELGLGDVRTLLNSGNVIFSARNKKPGALVARIEKALAAKLGLTSQVIVLSSEEVAAAVQENPLSKVATDPTKLLVLVPGESSDLARLRPLLKKQWAPEALALGSRVAYVWCANGVGKSPLWPAVDKALGRSGTARNMATMTKILAKVES